MLFVNNNIHIPKKKKKKQRKRKQNAKISKVLTTFSFKIPLETPVFNKNKLYQRDPNN